MGARRSENESERERENRDRHIESREKLSIETERSENMHEN